MRYASALLIAACAVSACDMIPDYMQPDLPVAKHWFTDDKDEPVSAEAQKAAADIAWQDFFQSEPMRQVIQTSLDNNRDLRASVLNVEAARALYRVQRSELVPHLNAQATGSKQHTPEKASQFGLADTTALYNANVGVTAFELDLFGRIRSLSEEALETYFATDEAQKAVRIALIGETANAYLQWLADKAALKTTQDTLDAEQKSFDLINKRFKSGISSKLDLAQAQTLLQTAKANQAQYDRFVAQDRNALILLMGVPDSAGAIPESETLNDVKLMTDLPVGLPSDVLLLRPDVRQAEHQLKAANADIGAARAAFFPTISLTGSFGFASRSLSDLFSGGTGGAWSFAPQATLPIFAGGRNVANLDYAKTEEKIAVANYEKSVQTAFREVADQLAARRTLDDQQKAETLLVQASQDSYDLSNARYKHGIDDFLSVLDSQRTLYGSQLGAIDTQRQYLANLVDLYQALGGGLMDKEKKEAEK